MFAVATFEQSFATHAGAMSAHAHFAHAIHCAKQVAVVFAEFTPALQRVVLDFHPRLGVAVLAHRIQPRLLVGHAARRDCSRAIACRQIATSE